MKNENILWIVVILLFLGGIFFYGGQKGWFATQNYYNTETTNSYSNPSQPATTTTQTTPTEEDTSIFPDIQWCKFFGGCKVPETDLTPVPLPDVNYVPPIEPVIIPILPAVSVCTEDDYGFNIYMKGHNTMQGGTVETVDTCNSDARSVFESFCKPDGYIEQASQGCPNGYGCWDGACQQFLRCGTIVPTYKEECYVKGGELCTYVPAQIGVRGGATCELASPMLI